MPTTLHAGHAFYLMVLIKTNIFILIQIYFCIYRAATELLN